MPNGEYTPSAVKELIRMHQQVREQYASQPTSSALTDADIDALIAIRERLTNRRDEQIDWVAVDHFDAVLAQVPAGTRNDVDLLLGRPAELPERVEYQLRPATDTAAATEAVAELAQKKKSEHDAYLESIADQHKDMLDFLRLCGDLAI